MKKLLIILSILIIISAVIFYFGWIQLKLEKDTYGVIFTKTGGYQDKALVSGNFAWSAAALIPKNLEITVIPAASRTIYLESVTQLPSSLLFRNTLVGPADFSYRLNFYISFQLKSEQVVQLVRDNGLSVETIENWYKATEDKIKFVASREIQLFLDNAPGNQDSVFISTENQEKILKRIQTHFDNINLHDLDIVSLTVPDLDLYAESKEYYYNLTAVKNSSLQSEMLNTAKQRAENEVQLELLERYGYLLNEFPILIEYIKADPDLRSLQ
ncbi:MAG: hypothetical protein HQ557_01345 [Bacteroidetes bacterium]|nr:hypothetical protein [Bacteroidota bacterium]